MANDTVFAPYYYLTRDREQRIPDVGMGWPATDGIVDGVCFANPVQSESVIVKANKRKRPSPLERMFSPTMWIRQSHKYSEDGESAVKLYRNYWGERNITTRERQTYYDFLLRDCYGGAGGSITYCPYLQTSTQGFPQWAWEWQLHKVQAKYPSVPKVTPSNHEILLKIKDEKMNIGMMVAEYRQTARMYGDAVRSLFDVARNIRKGRLDKLLVSGVKSAPQTWLMYRYGVTPHMSDLKACWELSHTAWQRPIIKRFSCDNKTHIWGISDWLPDGIDGVGSPDGKIRDIFNSYVTYRDIAWVEFDTSALSHETNQLGLTNPALLAWEVIPFSFVVDWFVNVGDTLSALDALLNVKRVACTRTTRERSDVSSSFGGMRFRKESYRRASYPLGGLPDPPRWEPSLTWKRLVDSAALAKGLLRR